MGWLETSIELAESTEGWSKRSHEIASATGHLRRAMDQAAEELPRRARDVRSRPESARRRRKLEEARDRYVRQLNVYGDRLRPLVEELRATGQKMLNAFESFHHWAEEEAAETRQEFHLKAVEIRNGLAKNARSIWAFRAALAVKGHQEASDKIRSATEGVMSLLANLADVFEEVARGLEVY